MSNDGIRRRCPKCRCGNGSIYGPEYQPEDNRLKLTCHCGYWWTTPTKEQMDKNVKYAQTNRGKEIG